MPIQWDRTGNHSALLFPTDREQAVFERFTERARQVVVLAPGRGLHPQALHRHGAHPLGIALREERDSQPACSSHSTSQWSACALRSSASSAPAKSVTSRQIPFTPRAKKVLELALREALSLGHSYIGTEHILLGLVRENEA